VGRGARARARTSHPGAHSGVPPSPPHGSHPPAATPACPGNAGSEAGVAGSCARGPGSGASCSMPAMQAPKVTKSRKGKRSWGEVEGATRWPFWTPQRAATTASRSSSGGARRWPGEDGMWQQRACRPRGDDVGAVWSVLTQELIFGILLNEICN
jgi:hypothetical protein